MKNASYGAYQDGVKRSETPTETDAAVLERAALLLEDASKIPGTEEFYMALNYNQRIWTVIQAFVTGENSWPELIVANLLSLSIFVDKQTFKAMAESDPEQLDVLININRQIAAGFRSVPPADQERKPAPTEDI